MSETTSSVSEKAEPDTSLHTQGPLPHEDLTIAEQLEAMWTEDKDHPGEESFRCEDGKTHSIDKDQLSRFLREFGALHPSDYQSQHGTDWRDDLFR
ncbi:MAG: hypothetical protein EOP88_15625 [Verrucomicrobiaceae bacterium]|nr:MAG: hypothetical protein EOP88_15625 [Verrucomicrobiaceae bacterium]